MSDVASWLPSRRSVLAAAGAGLLGLTGCLPDGGPPRPAVDPEVRTRARIAEEVRALSRRYAAVAAAFPGADPRLAEFLAKFKAEHDAHARALSGSASRAPSEDAASSGKASPGAPQPAVPVDPDAALLSLIAAEEAAARRRSRQAGRASPALARLLASIAGSEAAHAALLGSAGPA